VLDSLRIVSMLTEEYNDWYETRITQLLKTVKTR